MSYKFNPFTGNLDDIGDAAAGSGTVTDVSVVTANGLSGTVATSTTTPAITLDISGLDATKIADGTVTSTEFQYLGGVTSDIQTQISGLVPYTGATGDVDLGVHALTAHNIKPDASDGLLLESNNGTDIGILGAANTANVTWYGSHNFSTATENTIAGFTGAGKTLVSLATTTYPSLTELSYVKGVTSPIQTQLGNKQALDATLTALAGLTIAADSLTIGTGTDAFSQTTFAANTFPARASTGSLAAKTITDYALTILDDVDASTARATLGLTIGTNVQAYDADLTTWAGITPGTGVGTALAVNTGSAGAVVVNGGALGTPSSGTLTNATGLPAASVVAGTLGTGAYTMDTSLTVPAINGSTAANGDITINGTSSATKASSYVLLQPTGGNVGIGTTAPAAAMELASGGLYVSNYGSGVSVPGGGSIGMYLRGATSTSPFGFSAAGTGNISATAPLFYYSWVGASATKLGFSSYDASAIKDYIAFDYATGNFEVKAPAIEATSSTTIGTTTLADKFGNAYLTNGADIYPDNDVYGLWNRFVNYGFTPDEHWGQNADELTWTGWATYTSYVTPASITTNLSSYSVAHNNGVKSAFRYRSAATGAAIFLRARASVTFLNTGGVMIDDGTDTGDGNGANNFYRVYIKQTALGGAFQVFEEYRTGGGAVTTNTGPTIAYGQFSGIGLLTQGTRWTSWTAAPFTFGEAQSYVQFTGGTAAMSWTPARVGLYAKFSATDFGRRAVWDWYDESTS